MRQSGSPAVQSHELETKRENFFVRTRSCALVHCVEMDRTAFLYIFAEPCGVIQACLFNVESSGLAGFRRDQSDSVLFAHVLPIARILISHLQPVAAANCNPTGAILVLLEVLLKTLILYWGYKRNYVAEVSTVARPSIPVAIAVFTAEPRGWSFSEELPLCVALSFEEKVGE